MKKIIFMTIPAWVMLLLPLAMTGQTPSDKKKINPTKELSKGTERVSRKTANVNQDIALSASNIQQALENVKAVTKVFEPVFQLHGMTNIQAPEPVQGQDTLSAETPENQAVEQTPAEFPAVEPQYAPASSFYNGDGSANWGNQNHQEYGSYIDIMQGEILDDLAAITETGSVDLIFTATDHFGNAPAYALLTPAYVQRDFFANYYFRGIRYKDANVPPKSWPAVNESEVAVLNLSGAQFDRIQTNAQLEAVVKQAQSFRDHLEFRTKLTGKVFAVKTEISNRTAYGLIYVVDHLGTTGANGYLKVKIKVTGFDATGDGMPDAGIYRTN